MKSWICLFLVTLATATHAAPRKDLPPKKASHSIVQKAAKAPKAQRPSLQAKKAVAPTAKNSAQAAPARQAAGKAAAVAGAAALVVPTALDESSQGQTASASEAGMAGMAPVQTAMVAPTESSPPRSTWQGIRHSVSEKAHFMADKAHGVVDGAAHVVADRTTELVLHAMGFLGVPYRRGGNTVETGFDCSGFVRAMFQQTAGALLPRSAKEQADATEVIDKKELRPGDLVFFNTMRRAFSHVGIYVGEGKFIHSPRSGSVVRVEDMGDSYWTKRFNGARRVSDVDGAEVQAAIAAKRY